MGYNIGILKRASSNRKFREHASENIIKLIENEEYKSRSKAGPKGVFTRNRKLNFSRLLIFIARMGMKALQRELDDFYKVVMGSEFNIREVTKGAFSQARSQLRPEAFLELNENACKTFYDEAPCLGWKEHRLLAVDGTRLLLPNHPSIKEEFGEYGFGPNADSKRSMAIASMLYDVLNLVTIDAQLAAYDSSEKDLLNQHVPFLKKGDLLLLDRGYPSIALFYLLRYMGVDFCVRMKEDSWIVVKKFVKSRRRDSVVEMELPLKDHHLFSGFKAMISKPITCRLVRVTLDNGEREILCTSLLDQQKYEYKDFEELYHLRWNEEEAYKLLKTRAEIESFTGKTAIAVKQDFYAKIFAMTYCSILAYPIEEKVRKENEEHKDRHPQKINRTNALSMFRNISVGLILEKKIDEAIRAFDDIVLRTREIVRPGRVHERKKRPKKLYHMNYKAL